MPRKTAAASLREKEPAPADDNTENRILDAAEELFSQFGFEGTAVRAINAVASVNSGAIHYYFRTKEDLFRKVIQRRGRILADDRLRRLEACREEPGRPPLLEQIVHAYIAPYANPALGSAEQRLRFARLRAHLMVEQRENDPSLLGNRHESTGQRFVDTLAGALPHLSRREVRLRYLVMWSALNTLSAGLGPIALGERILGEDENPVADFERLIPRLTQMFADFFRADEHGETAKTRPGKGSKSKSRARDR